MPHKAKPHLAHTRTPPPQDILRQKRATHLIFDYSIEPEIESIGPIETKAEDIVTGHDTVLEREIEKDTVTKSTENNVAAV